MRAVIILLFSLFLTGGLFAQNLPGQKKNIFLPDPFKIKEGIATFVDFQQANYQIVYDITNKKVNYQAIIQFQSLYNGYPIFDVVKNPKKILLNGIPVSNRSVVTPDQETTVRVLNRSVVPGSYEMIIEGEILEDITFERSGAVTSGFWYNDQEDRSFLEKYLPTNLEFDQYKMNFTITQLGLKKQQIVYTNGIISPSNQVNSITIEFPDFYNSNSLFFHLLDEETTTQVTANFRSKRSNKVIPVTIYGIMANQMALTNAMNSTMQILNQLEREVGPYPHDRLLIHLVPDDMGGVEYAAAIVSEQKNLRHELFHQYLSKGFMPVNGNASWIDEAICTWFDKNKPKTNNMKGTYNLANQNTYTRTTDSKAYSHGVEFISYLDQYLINQGRPEGIMAYLRFIAGNRIKQRYSTQSFIFDMENFYQLPLDPIFKKYVY